MTSEQWARLSGRPVFDSKGQTLGDVRRIFYDDATNEPSWATVGAKRYGDREAIVPLAGSKISGNGLTLGVRGSQVTQAPTIDADEDLTTAEVDTVSRHYDLGTDMAAGSGMDAGTDMDADMGQRGAPARAEMTRFEEQLDVGTETVETGKAKLRKRVQTEPVETDVQLRHEKARVEHMPARDTGDGESHRFGEETAEVTLHDQQPKVRKKTVPVETVRLATEADTDQEHISDELRKERIEVDDEPAGGRRRR